MSQSLDDSNCFRDLYAQLDKITYGKTNYSKCENEIKSLIEQITEFLINSDKTKNSLIFDIFCSLDILGKFNEIIKNCNRVVNTQIIKSFSLLIANFSNQQSLFYILSSNCINSIISVSLEDFDADLLYYYVNFAKSLALKIDETTVQFFFNRQLNVFPLLTNTLKFYNHPDPMISNVVRNIFLTICKIKYPPIIEFVCSMPTLYYFTFICCRVRDLIKILNTKIVKNKPKMVNTVNEEIINDILYFQDIFSLGIPRLNFILTNCIYYYIILSLLFESLVNKEKSQIKSTVGIYCLILFLKYIKDQNFVNDLITLVFSNKIYYKITNMIKNVPKEMATYESDWDKDIIRNKKKKFREFIMQNYSEKFVKSLIFHIDSPYGDIQSMIKKLEERFKGQNTSINPNDPEVYSSILTELNQCFSNRELNIIRENHSSISKATGIQVGLSFKDDRHCFSRYMAKNYSYIKQEYSSETDPKKFPINNVKVAVSEIFFSTSSKHLFLCLVLSHLVMTKENISKEILSFTKLMSGRYVLENMKSIQPGSEHNEAKKQEIKNPTEKQKPQDEKTEEKINFANLLTYAANPKFCLVENEINELFDNEKIKDIMQNNQCNYNIDFIGRLICLLIGCPLLRTETNRALIEIITNSIMSVEGKDKKPLKIELAHLNQLKSIYLNHLSDLTDLLLKSKVVQHSCITLYEKTLELYQEPFSKLLERLLSTPYEFLIEEVQETDSGKEEVSNFKTILLLSLMVYDILELELGIEKITFKKPDLTPEKTEENKTNDLSLQEEISCKICKKNGEGFNEGFLSFKDHILTLRMESPEYYNKIKINNVDVQMSRENNQIMNVIYETEDGEIKGLSVFFEEEEKGTKVKRILEDESIFIRNNDFRMMKDHFFQLQEQCRIVISKALPLTEQKKEDQPAK